MPATKSNLQEFRGKQGLGKVFLCAGLVGIGLVTFLSLRSSPAISTVRWMPKIIANWADRHGQFCNFPAYGLGAVPFLMIATTLRRQAWVMAALALLIVSLEIIQLAIPTRVCDLADIAWGWAGLAVAWAMCWLMKKMGLTIGSKPKPML